MVAGKAADGTDATEAASIDRGCQTPAVNRRVSAEAEVGSTRTTEAAEGTDTAENATIERGFPTLAVDRMAVVEALGGSTRTAEATVETDATEKAPAGRGFPTLAAGRLVVAEALAGSTRTAGDAGSQQPNSSSGLDPPTLSGGRLATGGDRATLRKMNKRRRIHLQERQPKDTHRSHHPDGEPSLAPAGAEGQGVVFGPVDCRVVAEAAVGPSGTPKPTQAAVGSPGTANAADAVEDRHDGASSVPARATPRGSPRKRHPKASTMVSAGSMARARDAGQHDLLGLEGRARCKVPSGRLAQQWRSLSFSKQASARHRQAARRRERSTFESEASSTLHLGRSSAQCAHWRVAWRLWVRARGEEKRG